MRKRLNRAKQDNKGLTLIEIVVTIAIIGIVAVPLLNSFMVGMRTNNVARKAEDAAQEAQNLAEIFQTTDIDTLETVIKSGSLAASGTTETETGATAESADTETSAATAVVSTAISGNLGKYTKASYTKSFATGMSADSAGHYPVYSFVFGNRSEFGEDGSETYYVVGDGNEKYYLEATLTATDISEIPDMVDVGDVSVIKVDEAYYKYDKLFQTSDGYTKTATLKIEGKCTEAGSGDEAAKYEYTIKMDVVYTKSSTLESTTYNVLDKTKTISAGEDVNIYLVCKFFDEVQPSSDKINIDYKFNSDELEQNCNVFLIQQSSSHAALNPDNITITKTGGAEFATEKDIQGLFIYSNVGTDSNPLKMTYIKDGVAQTPVELSGTTAITKNKYTIYQLEIKVHEDSKDGKVAAKLTTTVTE